MLKIRTFIDKLSKFQKVTCVILILGLVLLLSIGIPTLARYRNRNTIVGIPVWDGSIATSYKFGEGTEGNPYIISNGSELAYFYKQLLNTDYANTYFTLSNDIIINSGTLTYDSTNGIQYTIDNNTYFVEEYSNRYYDSSTMVGKEKGNLNIFKPLNGFKGVFDGASHTIYGLYITNKDSEELGLFTNLKGNVSNLYVENSIVYGGIVTGGIASTTDGSTISNVVYDGFVIGKNSSITKNNSFVPNSPTIDLQSTETLSNIDLSNSIPFIGSEIISTTITGKYTLTNADDSNTVIKINGVTVTNGSFEINLGSSILSSISVSTLTSSQETSPTLVFSNLSYNIVYDYASSGGIVAIAKDTSIINSINKSYVYGYSTSGGLVGVTTSFLTINQSYNVGNINGEYVSGGMVGTIEKSANNITISRSYNSGDIFATNIGGMIGFINNNSGTLSIDNSFNTSSTNYSIGTINSTTVNVDSVYFVNGTSAINGGTINGSFTQTSLDNLKTKDYVISNLTFNEFVSYNDVEINTQNVWIYGNSELPILFIDDLSNQIANINAGIYSWNNFSDELNTIFLTSNISFNIEATNELVPIKEKYYYISNSAVPLTKYEVSQITSWTPYTDVVQISSDGIYVIYSKIVDNNDNITYLNTDILNLELSTSSVSVGFGNIRWSKFTNDLDYLHIDRPDSLTVGVSESLPVLSIKYYISTQIKTTEELNLLGEENWTTYSNGIQIYDNGTYVVYVKVTDTENNVIYINTDYIVLNGYNENELIIGRNSSSYLNENPYITNKSVITLNLNYSNSSLEYLTGYNHNIISNILLPIGAKMTLIDNITKKIYEYKITTDTDIYNYENSCDVNDLSCTNVATYPLSLFKETGTGTTSKPFSESFYYSNGTINENFTIVLDLSNTNISINYTDVMMYMELRDSRGSNIIPTLYSTIKKFNIYSKVNDQDTNASLKLSTNYNGTPIEFNSNSVTNINITSGLNYKYVNSNKIIDTSYENKIIGLSIKMVDSNGNIVSNEYLKNIAFKVGDNLYYPKEDGIARINFNDGIADITKDLTIITYENNSNISDGEYYFKISNYASYDGIYYNQLGTTELSIPVTITNSYPIQHSFDVIMDDAYRIIDKSNSSINIKFKVLQNGNMENPNIKVSLYKKNDQTSYNQNYSIVDLSTFVSDQLNKYIDNIYYVSTNPVIYDGSDDSYNNFELNLTTTNFDNTGYKFVFDLYSGNRKIDTVSKYFVVR